MPIQFSTLKQTFKAAGLFGLALAFGGGSAKADADHHYAEEDVHVLQRVAPTYPAIAHQIHLSGVVVLDMAVAEDGTVENATVISGNPILSSGAMQAAKRWKFSPVMEQGKAAKATVRVSFRFTDH